MLYGWQTLRIFITQQAGSFSLSGNKTVFYGGYSSGTRHKNVINAMLKRFLLDLWARFVLKQRGEWCTVGRVCGFSPHRGEVFFHSKVKKSFFFGATRQG